MPSARIYPPRTNAPLPNARDVSVDSDEDALNVYSPLDPLEESDNDIKSIILDQLRKYRHVSLKIKKNNSNGSRFAILSFENMDALNYFKRAILEKRDRIIVYEHVLFFHFNKNRIVHHNNSSRNSDRFDEIRPRRRERSPPARIERYRSASKHDHRESSRHRKPFSQVSRTLYVGGLDEDIESTELRRVFEPYGVLLEVTIKHPSAPHSQPYAFVKFKQLSSALTARECLNDTFVGRKRLQIGYGKITPTHALWIGGLNENTTEEELATEVKRYSRYTTFEIRKEENTAYFLFNSIEDCRRAYNELSDVKLVHSGAKLEVDYADTHSEAAHLTDNPRIRDNRERRKRSLSSSSRSSGRFERNSTSGPRVRRTSSINSRQQIKVNRKENREVASASSSSYTSGGQSPTPRSRRSLSKDRMPSRAKLISDNNDAMSVNLNNPENEALKVEEINSRASSITPVKSIREQNKRTCADPSDEYNNKEKRLVSPHNNYASNSNGSIANTSSSSKLLLPNLSTSFPAVSANTHTNMESVTALSQILACYPVVWKGGICFKNNLFYLNLHIICGSVDAVSTMVHQAMLSGGDPTVVYLTKRFPLLPDRVMDLRTKLATAIASRDCCILIAQPYPGSDTKESTVNGLSTKNMPFLIKYFQEKQAAGLGTVGTASIYAFPPSPFAQEQLTTLMPHAVAALNSAADSYLMVVISR